jgi:hypothetical protein
MAELARLAALRNQGIVTPREFEGVEEAAPGPLNRRAPPAHLPVARHRLGRIT